MRQWSLGVVRLILMPLGTVRVVTRVRSARSVTLSVMATLEVVPALWKTLVIGKRTVMKMKKPVEASCRSRTLGIWRVVESAVKTLPVRPTTGPVRKWLIPHRRNPPPQGGGFSRLSLEFSGQFLPFAAMIGRMTDRSEIRAELDVWLNRNAELENILRSKGVQINPFTFVTARLNALIDHVLGPIEDMADEDDARIRWEIKLATDLNGALTTANQEVDTELRKATLTQGVVQVAQQLHIPR